MQVLYLTDPVDEAMVSSLAKYGDFDLADVSKDGLNLSDTEEDTKKVRPRAGAWRWFVGVNECARMDMAVVTKHAGETCFDLTFHTRCLCQVADRAR